MKIEISECINNTEILRENEKVLEIFVAIQKSKIPANLTQVGTWVARAYRDKGWRVIRYIETSATADFSMATAVAVCEAWQGERVKFHWSAEARARANGVVVGC